MSNLVDSWLTGIGLGYAVPIFAGQGIDSPDMLAELDVVDFPELGVSDQNDRKKLFYLIQRVRLALNRGRATENSKTSAPRGDTAASSAVTEGATAAAAGGYGETGAAGSTAAPASVRFRREREMPASRGAVVSLRAGPAGGISAAAGGDAGGGGVATDAPLTPARTQRLPPSHRRPKTPHVDGATDRGRQQQPAERLAVAATTGSGAAGSGVEQETSVHAVSGEQQKVGGHRAGGRAPEAPALRRKLSRRTYADKSSEQHRSVLEPVQLDETGGRTRLSASSQSTAAAAESRPMPPPLSPELPRPAPVSRSRSREVVDTSKNFAGIAVAAVKMVPPQPPQVAHDPPASAGRAPRRRPSPLGRRDAPSCLTAASPVANAAAADPSRPAQEVARLYRSKRDAAGAAAAAARRGESAPRSLGRLEDSAGLVFPVAGVGELQLEAAYPPLSMSEEEAATSEEDGGSDGHKVAEAAAAAVAVAGDRRESAGSLAVQLVTAHREDVRSALAAARKDMDLVSRADQDRRPAALMAYTREAEAVLGQRIVAGTRLRQALDNYMALRQSASAAVAKVAPGLGQGGDGLQGGRLRSGQRALQA